MVSDEMAVYVKHEMTKHGFHSGDFASVPNDLSRGSRDALLALGWLLCKLNIIPRFMQKVTSPLDDDTTSIYEVCIRFSAFSSKAVDSELCQFFYI